MDVEEREDLAYPWKHHVAGMWQTFRGKRDNAVAHYVAALEQDPADWSALYFVLQRLQSAGQNAEALEVAQRALGTEPDHFLALQTAACLAVKLGRHADAKGYVERSLEAMPKVRPGSMPILDALYLAAHRVARLLGRPRALRLSPEVPSRGAVRELEEWKQWASGYLAWHAGAASGDGAETQE